LEQIHPSQRFQFPLVLQTQSNLSCSLWKKPTFRRFCMFVVFPLTCETRLVLYKQYLIVFYKEGICPLKTKI
jgi:hypothetical protein